jgi:ketosteroid isomerase-like protein
MERPDYYGNPAGLTEDLDVVHGVLGAFADRDVERALRFVDPHCEVHLEGTARRIGRTEPYMGHDGMREYFADVARLWDELEIHADDFRVIPGSVIVMGVVDGRIGGERVRRAAMWTWRMRDGRASYLRVTDLGHADA